MAITEQSDVEVETSTTKSVPYDDESIVWAGGPSQWTNFFTFTWWTIFLVITVVFMLIWGAGLRDDYNSLIGSVVTWTCYAIIFISILSMFLAYLSVHYEHTTITKNKIKEAKGITRIFRQELFCEISDINDVKSPPPGLLGLLGLSTLIIETVDSDQPIIKIRAISDRDELVTLLLPIWRELKIERKGYFN